MKHFLISILLLSSVFCYSQVNYFGLDTLKNKSQRGSIFHLTTQSKTKKTLKEAELFNRKAIEIAHSFGSDSLLAECYGMMCFNYYRFSELSKAISISDTVNSYSIISKHKSWHIQSNILKGTIYKMAGKKDSAFIFYEIVLNLAMEYNDSLRMADAYNNLGNYYRETFLDDKQAKKYFLKALEMYNLLKSPEKEKQNVYRNLALVSNTKKETDYYFNLAEKYIKIKGNPEDKIIFYLHQANAYNDKQRLKEALRALNLAINNANKSKIAYYNRFLFTLKGMILVNLERFQEAIPILENVYKNFDLGANKEALETNLLIAYEKEEQYKKALDLAEILINRKDSLLKLKNSNISLEFDAKYKAAEKDKTIIEQNLKIQEQQNERNRIVIILLILLLVIVVIFQYFLNHLKKKKLITESEISKSKEINKVRSELLTNISHEIRTPLTLILGNIELAIEEKNSTKIKEFLLKALNSTKRAVWDANQILELLSVENKKMEVFYSSVSINDFCKRVLFSFKSLSKSKNINLQFKSNINKDCILKIDEEKTEKVLNNLIANAIKYSDIDTAITLDLDTTEEQVCITIIDEGYGIPEKEQKRIFERFYQGEKTKNSSGVGVGLALSKEIVHALNGQLKVKSKENEGSEFILSLPLKISHEKEESKEVVVYPNIPNEKSKILIVEDNREMREFLVEILKRDYYCVTAQNGEEAIKLLENNSFDLVSSDIMMPKIDGYEFKKIINERFSHLDLPFIFISAKNLEEDLLLGLSMGVDDYILKPFNKSELLARIKNILANKKQRVSAMASSAKENLQSPLDLINHQDAFIKKVQEIIIKNMGEEDFKVTNLSEEIGYSQRQLTRILKESIGMTPVQYILEMRLQRAYILIKNKTKPTLSEIKYEVGMSSSSYFNKKFKDRFGISPSEVDSN